ncbi:MAG: tRNA (N6-threonylcarbamoyladenosine(37)-N6)-methyltransferase TrmO [Kiritimatiellaeota bacterium]|nr:tRNA (N6-threonylcarbamoyladenosine(37)-N6)-methyltransferase TrmO [Kiritimatiellota bacterium]
MKNSITYKAIGMIYSEHTVPENTPIQPVYAQECNGTIEVFPKFADGLADLEGFSHIYLLYHFHRCENVRLKVKPFLQDVERGVFSTRAPCRPNGIGMSIVRLIRRDGNTLYVQGIDVLDGAPLLDIKPYTTRFDCIQTDRNGWHDDVPEDNAQVLGKRNFK